jgi:hypothetical protein
VHDVELSPNFRLSEMLRSDRALHLGIPNTPTPSELEHLRALCVELLQPLRDALGMLHVTSGLRRPELNSAVGGVESSAHLIGWAADVHPPPQVSRTKFLEWLANSGLAFDQAILESTWVHLGLRRPGTGEQRRQMLVESNGSFSLWVPSKVA